MKIDPVKRDSGPSPYTVPFDKYRVRETMREQTFKERAEELVAKSAEIIRLRTFATPQHLSAVQQRLALWNETEEGRALTKAKQLYGDLPMSEVVTKIRKRKADDYLTAGYAVLEKGFPQARPTAY